MKNFQHSFLDQIIQVDYLTSTMEKAEELIEENKITGNFLIISDKQGRGVGRRGNNWYSPAGGLWFSIGIYGFCFGANFTLFCGIQILKAIDTIIAGKNIASKIKWPNDIYLKGKKAAGIIVKNLSGRNYYIVGIGINTNLEIFPEELQNTATSLKLETGTSISNQLLLTGIMDNLANNLPDYLSGYKLDEEYYAEHDLLKNQTIMIKTEFAEFSGLYHGISPAGAIQLKLSNGAIQPFYAGEIQIIS
ncbi:MAG: biotin--[acetyl-CoA-carboxylase] ligase [Candidatus Cloacimonetes bacterium]|nr:biotin--[acetyl-CoA-carboxylase] ligase [Candidatus Cloacimonadota bacterium]